MMSEVPVLTDEAHRLRSGGQFHLRSRTAFLILLAFLAEVLVPGTSWPRSVSPTISRDHPEEFVLIIPRLKGDAGAMTQVLVKIFGEIGGVRVITTDQELASQSDPDGLIIEEGFKEVKAVLTAEAGAAVLWGEIQEAAEGTALDLFWTGVSDSVPEAYPKRYFLGKDPQSVRGLQTSLMLDLWIQAESDVESYVRGKNSRMLAEARIAVNSFAALVRGAQHNPMSWLQLWDEADLNYRLRDARTTLAYGFHALGIQGATPEDLRAALTLLRGLLTELQRNDKSGHDYNFSRRIEVQAMLGQTLTALGYLENTTPPVIEGIEFYRKSLAERLRAGTPFFDIAGIYVSLANALRNLAKMTQNPTTLREAITEYRRAASLFNPEHSFEEWAQIQPMIGSAYMFLGELEKTPAPYENALAIYQQLATFFTPEKDPKAWAVSKHWMGLALLGRGELDGTLEPFQRAAEVYREALQVFTPEADPDYWIVSELNLGEALREVAHRTGRVGGAWEALDIELRVLEFINGQESTYHDYTLEEIKKDIQELKSILGKESFGDEIKLFEDRLKATEMWHAVEE